MRSEPIPPAQFHDQEARQAAATAYVLCALICACAYASTVWGYDTWVLVRSRTELGWSKVLIGVPLLLGICCALGSVAARVQRTWFSVLGWGVAGLLSGLVAGWVPFGGHTVATWVVEPRLRGVDLYPLGVAGVTRMWFVAFVTGAVGMATGLVVHVLAEKAWDRLSTHGKFSLRAVGPLFLCAPLAVLPGIATDDVVNHDLRLPQRLVYELVTSSVADAETVALASIAPYRDQFVPPFWLHLVEYDMEMGSTVVDVVFANNFALRCYVLGETVTNCVPFLDRLSAWIQALMSDLLSDGGTFALTAYADQIQVNADTFRWLASQRSRLSDMYVLSRQAQHGGWIRMAMEFGDQAVLHCDFYGASPVVLDRCVWAD